MRPIHQEQQGIRRHTPVEDIIKEWDRLSNQIPLSRTSVRVFEGDLYSLMDDDEFYEETGCRKLINILTSTWDCLRANAIGEEPLNWGSRTINRTAKEQDKLNENISEFDRWIYELPERVGDY